MSDALDTEALVERLRPWLRDEYLVWFDAGLAWGWPRCRTHEERLLFPFLLAALSPFKAVVAPRRLVEGNRVSFQVSLGHEREGRAVRVQFNIACEEDAFPDTVPEPPLRIPSMMISQRPWEAAAHVAVEAQRRMLDLTRVALE